MLFVFPNETICAHHSIQPSGNVSMMKYMEHLLNLNTEDKRPVQRLYSEQKQTFTWLSWLVKGSTSNLSFHVSEWGVHTTSDRLSCGSATVTPPGSLKYGEWESRNVRRPALLNDVPRAPLLPLLRQWYWWGMSQAIWCWWCCHFISTFSQTSPHP